MTRTITRTVFAMALALGMLAAVSNSSHAALSTADRQDGAVAQVRAPETATLAATSATAPATLAPATPVAATAAQVAEQPRKTVVRKAAPRSFAVGPRGGYPCH
jgi:hypothetical protein